MTRPPGNGLAAQLACILEVSARKPGNVHPGQAFPGLTYLDFLMSAAAIAPEMDLAAGRPAGATIVSSIRATRQVVNTNTNLGIVLLLAPLAHADGVANRVEPTLSALTVADARLAYEAIRLAGPGGLGRVDEQDAANEPTVTLRAAMALAADRDTIALQYVNNFRDVFDGAEFLTRDIERGNGLEPAIIALQRRYLCKHLDSLVLRKRGRDEAHELRRRAQGGEDLQPWFAAGFPHRNPGTTADLICASLFVALRSGSIPLPVSL